VDPYKSLAVKIFKSVDICFAVSSSLGSCSSFGMFLNVNLKTVEIELGDNFNILITVRSPWRLKCRMEKCRSFYRMILPIWVSPFSGDIRISRVSEESLRDSWIKKDSLCFLIEIWRSTLSMYWFSIKMERGSDSFSYIQSSLTSMDSGALYSKILWS
jgi:hypothetical protein